MRSKYFEEDFCSCECHEEVLRVCFDPEDTSWGLDLAIFDRRYQRTFTDKLKLAWRFLKYGSPYHDQIILERSQVDGLIKFFESFAKEDDKNVECLEHNKI